MTNYSFTAEGSNSCSNNYSLPLPGLDLDDGLFRAWWFEPFVATLSFAMSIHIYWYEERKRGLSMNNELWKMVGVSSTGVLYNSCLAYWAGIYLLKTVHAVLGFEPTKPPDGTPYNVENFCHLMAEVVTGVILYDAVFFFVHWLLHDVPYVKEWHKKHHHGHSPQHQQQPSLEAREVLRHSIMDGSLQVICNILVQQYHFWPSLRRKSRRARILHNVVLPWMLTEAHSASPVPWIWRRWCVGVREHRFHHLGLQEKHVIRRHQQFFGYLDGVRELLRKSGGSGNYDLETKKL